MKLILSLLCLTFATGTLAGQIYRWVDDKGVTQFTDQPPPPKATRKVETVKARGNVVEVDKASYSMRQAASQSPVVLFTSDCGVPCTQARDFLRQRGIPYTTKQPQTVKADAEELKSLVGALEVPVIKVGRAHYKGFEADTWEGLLTAAGYPKESRPASPPAAADKTQEKAGAPGTAPAANNKPAP